MPTRRAPWWMFIVAASFLAYVSVVFYQTFWGPNLLGIDLEFVAGKGVVWPRTEPGFSLGTAYWRWMGKPSTTLTTGMRLTPTRKLGGGNDWRLHGVTGECKWSRPSAGLHEAN